MRSQGLLAGLRLAAMALLLAAAAARASSVTVTVDTAQRFQRVDGFGFSVRVWSDPHLANKPSGWVPDWARQEVIKRLFGELGATRAHLLLDGGIEAANDNADPLDTDSAAFNFAGKRTDEFVAFVSEARPQGLQVFYPVPLRLEKWMSALQPDEYVEWAMAILLRWRDMGAEPPYFAIYNEPRARFSPNWWRRVVRSLGTRMRAAGLATMLVIPEDVNACSALAVTRSVLDDAEARRHVGAVSYHEYEYTAHEQGAACRAQIRALAQQHGLPVWMSEHYRGAGFDGALAWGKEMHRLLAEDEVNAVDHMWGFFGAWQAKSTLIELDFTGTGFFRHVPNATYYVTGQYARYVRPGDRRVGAQSSDPAVLASAFAGPQRIALVLINDGTEARDAQIDLQGASVGTLAGERTSAEESWVRVEARPVDGEAGRFVLALPPRSVTSLRGGKR